MHNLLVDIGNTAIKTALGNSGTAGVKLLSRTPYDKRNFQKDFSKSLKALPPKISIGRIGICALKDADEKFLSRFLKEQIGIKPVFITRKLRLPLRISYGKGLGNDRICSAAAARVLENNRNILVIDFGTATTFTLISGKTLTGGMISPGIETSLMSLTNRTSLPEIKISFPKKLVNNNTADNIRAGVLFQSLFSAERFITETKKEYKDLYVIATGGYAQLMKSKTCLIDKSVPKLVLEGINIIISQ